MLDSFFKQYRDELVKTLDMIDAIQLSELADVLWMAYQQGRRIYVIGNGGSAATASHYVCDFGKGATIPGEKRLKIMSLTDNVSHMTAISNDLSYKDVFKEQLENLLEPKDVVIAISASGNSSNVVTAVAYANEIGAVTAGILGFDGGKLKQMTQHCLVIENFNYGQVEDAHLILGHVLSQYFRTLIQARSR